MTINKVSSTRSLVRMMTTGVLLSMVTMFFLHYFGSWEAHNFRPDPETTSSVVLYNKCAVLGHMHVLRPGGATSAATIIVDELKFSGSFMNFSDGHVVAMILLAVLFSVVLFAIRQILFR